MSDINNKRLFINLPCYAKHTYCSICLDILNNPVNTECDHYFCEECITKTLKINTKCPECRCDVNKTFKNIILKNIISKYSVLCPNSGCPWIGLNKEFDNHYKNCNINNSIPLQLKNSEKESERIKKLMLAEENKHILINSTVTFKERLYQIAYKEKLYIESNNTSKSSKFTVVDKLNIENSIAKILSEYDDKKINNTILEKNIKVKNKNSLKKILMKRNSKENCSVNFPNIKSSNVFSIEHNLKHNTKDEQNFNDIHKNIFISEKINSIDINKVKTTHLSNNTYNNKKLENCVENEEELIDEDELFNCILK